MRARAVTAFSRTGLALAREVKAQLPDWTVIYFDQAASERRAEGAERETFEYQVGL